MLCALAVGLPSPSSDSGPRPDRKCVDKAGNPVYCHGPNSVNGSSATASLNEKWR